MIRVPIGGYLRGGAPYHSQSGEAIFAHTPGIRIVFRRPRRTPPVCCARPSAATTRCCSSSTSTSTGRPTTRAPYPGPDYTMPFGKASVRARGHGHRRCSPGAPWCSAPCWPRSRPRRDGISVAVIDLRSIIPYDWDTIAHTLAARTASSSPRGSADVRIRRRDRRPHLRRAVRGPGRRGNARRLAGPPRGLRNRPRRGHPARLSGRSESDQGSRRLLVLGALSFVLGPSSVLGPFLVLGSWSLTFFPVGGPSDEGRRTSGRTKDQGRTENQAPRTKDQVAC